MFAHILFKTSNSFTNKSNELQKFVANFSLCELNFNQELFAEFKLKFLAYWELFSIRNSSM